VSATVGALAALDDAIESHENERALSGPVYTDVAALREARAAVSSVSDKLLQIALLAEFGTTGPGKCGSPALTAEQATSLRMAISDIAREALARIGGQP
jgi:hypothetical protein